MNKGELTDEQKQALKPVEGMMGPIPAPPWSPLYPLSSTYHLNKIMFYIDGNWKYIDDI